MNKQIKEWFSILNQRQIRYGMGGSWMLKEYGLPTEPKDIDLFIHSDDINKCLDLIEPYQIHQVNVPDSPFKTTFFATLQIESMSIDIMGGFAYLHDQGLYKAIFDDHSIVSEVIVDDVHIPLMSLEEWYVLYIVMGRQKQCELIENHWKHHGMDHSHLLQRQWSCNLDDESRIKIEQTIKGLID
ncbi:MAG: hypothetical protein LRY24_01415 [Erysipelotrichaceae bacterium]|nr:hypothetical protein [Erysipelotrichaceae bacterium]MCD8574288.1 hypothetical protein [Erysipelotrichaceae bacterium]